jgi:sulfur-oxidizing protein SoxZ
MARWALPKVMSTSPWAPAASIMADIRRISVPKQVEKGQIFTVRTLARHEMEPGVRFDADRFVVTPRHLLQEVMCHYNGRRVFYAEWFSAVSSNPYLTFRLRAERSGDIVVTWVDDYNVKSTATARIEVVEPSKS